MPEISPFLLLPFVLLLGAMAVAPAAAPRWWGRHYAGVALGLGAVTLGVYLFGLHASGRVVQVAHEYLGFIVLIGSLFVVSGGIHLQAGIRGTPFSNAMFLLVGALVANLLGTTGAAMLLIRPWIHLNRARVAAHHIVFFIFIVANVGGCLTPIGDPPLFLGYLQGVPFWWVAKNCWPMWLTGVGALTTLFYVVDKVHFTRAADRMPGPEPGGSAWKFEGRHNLFFLAVILGAVFIQHPPLVREGLMLAAAAGSYFTTPREVHRVNEFDFHPLIEVAVLFAGIFATMMPALDWLNTHARALLGGEPSAGTFFWGAGVLSSVLDNAPTYLGFLSALLGVAGAQNATGLLNGSAAQVLGISLGAVFFGAATYIGNGPNFMVKAVAEQRGVPAPGFFPFIVKFSLPFLLPVLLLVWCLFFRD